MGSIESLFVSNTHYKMRLNLAIVISFLHVILYHSTQARFTEEQIENLAFNLLNPCERAIWSCCQSDRPDFVQPTFCFERNGCFGLQWLGQNACSPRLINSMVQPWKTQRPQSDARRPIKMEASFASKTEIALKND